MVILFYQFLGIIVTDLMKMRQRKPEITKRYVAATVAMEI
jgi:hypothetical protein